ncbi:MAG TPA: DNA repair protein RadA, partial [Burkholderiales bacterium]|nr:DNA repair protein RadA [Burkholderiales bacterium]
MAKPKSAYVCSDCGATALQWFGACPSCGAAGTLTETITERPSRGTIAVARQSVDSVLLGNIRVSEAERRPTGIGELDRVLGGGL